MRTLITLIVLLASLYATTVEASKIYGTLTENNKAAAGLQVEISCDSVSEPVPVTPKNNGSYSVGVNATGYCKFIVTNRPGNPELEIYLYDEPTRHDLNLTRDSDGTYALKKK